MPEREKNYTIQYFPAYILVGILSITIPHAFAADPAHTSSLPLYNAATDLRDVSVPTPSSRNDVVSATASPSSGPCAPSHQHLDAVSVNCGEKFDLTEIKRLSRVGATTLALRLLDKQQQSKDLSPDQWIVLETERINIYAARKEWNSIIKRLSDTENNRPQTSRPEFKNWANIQLVKAYIQSDQGGDALPLLRWLIWGYPDNPNKNDNSNNYPLLRRLVIEAYLATGHVADAHTAMLRYQQDYGSSGLEWKLLRAEVLLRANRAADAEQLLKREKGPDAQSLYYLARLKNSSVRPAEINKAAIKLALKKDIQSNTRKKLWVVAASAAEKKGDTRGQITAISQALVNKKNITKESNSSGNELFPVSGKSLWRAYYTFGRSLGNQMQLLIGSDDEWFVAASNLMDKDSLKSRALFSVLATDSSSVRTRKLAHENFSNLLAREKSGIPLLRQLYLAEDDISLSLYLPETVRHHLVDDALSRSEITIASRLMGNLTAPPEGTDAVRWNLRRARVLIMGGNQDQGVAALKSLMLKVESMTRQQVDRLMQVLFDLQAIGKHREAILLFTTLERSQGDIQLRREILYWMADSYKALGEYMTAARMYLKSAVLLSANDMDPWAQTARYHAADALAKAGILDDARFQYNMLLKATKDPSRRTVIRNRLQQLWLTPAEDLSGKKTSQ